MTTTNTQKPKQVRFYEDDWVLLDNCVRQSADNIINLWSEWVTEDDGYEVIDQAKKLIPLLKKIDKKMGYCTLPPSKRTEGNSRKIKDLEKVIILFKEAQQELIKEIEEEQMGEFDFIDNCGEITRCKTQEEKEKAVSHISCMMDC